MKLWKGYRSTLPLTPLVKGSSPAEKACSGEGLTVTDEILFPLFVNFAFKFAQVVLKMNQLSELMDIIWIVGVQHVLAVFREVEQSRV